MRKAEEPGGSTPASSTGAGHASDPGPSPATTEEIELFVEDLLEACNDHDLDRLATFYAPEYEGVDVGKAAPYRGPQGAARRIESYLRAFPDLHLARDETIVQGDRVALLWTARGTHEGELMHIPPTGRKVVVRGVSWLTLREGKIERGLYVWDVAGLLREIKLLPDL